MQSTSRLGKDTLEMVFDRFYYRTVVTGLSSVCDQSRHQDPFGVRSILHLQET